MCMLGRRNDVGAPARDAVHGCGFKCDFGFCAREKRAQIGTRETGRLLGENEKPPQENAGIEARVNAYGNDFVVGARHDRISFYEA